ncbi:hypothetical protein SEA_SPARKLEGODDESS_3 [Streptomyces phage SparkleGoddess]|nr:hypothetical protein SEA_SPARKLEGODDESS_3 [Streptomyces phage SparkleGoddess]
MSQENYEEVNMDAFAPENFNKVMLIQTMRIYDLLLAILSIDSPQKAAQIAEMHEAGLTFNPAPAFSLEVEEE